MRKITLLIILGSFFLTLSACTKSDDSNTTTIETKETFVVGMECNYAPYNWTTPTETETSYPINGTNQYCDGYDVKIAKTIADELGYELVIKSMSWEGLIPALNSNQIDAIIAGMSPTEKRKITITFTDPYYRSADTTSQVVILLGNGTYSGATSINDFNGANIAAQLATLQDEEGLIEQLTGATHATPLEDYPSLVMALNAFVIDGFIAELPVAQQIIAQNDNLVYIDFEEGNGFTIPDAFTTTAIGLRKSDTELKNSINQVLSNISDGQRTSWMDQFVQASSGE